jgi:hypothetical protein
MAPEEKEFPNCDKVSENIKKIRLLHEFMEYLGDQGLKLYDHQEMDYEDEDWSVNHPKLIWKKISGMMPTRKRREELVHGFFEIDSDELSKERQQMFEKYVCPGSGADE